MSNSYFRFKQFTVHQDRCAMKVGVDGVLLGAWSRVESSESILDVGTGTGLLALMAAQRSSAKITAIEIDEAAAKQATENFQLSPWSKRMECKTISLQDFSNSTQQKFDSVICNPPFFSGKMQPGSTNRAIARHSIHLSPEELIRNVAEILLPNGVLSLIYPYSQIDRILENASGCAFRPVRITKVFSHRAKPAYRALVELSPDYRKDTLYNELVIRETPEHEFTKPYRRLTSAYYLNM